MGATSCLWTNARWSRSAARESAWCSRIPLTSLNPALTIGSQIAETHAGSRSAMSRAEAERQAIELLAHVGVADPATRARTIRIISAAACVSASLIAAAIGCPPSVIIADEPTTALDVTVQAKILRLLHDLQQRHARVAAVDHP